jgi:hypothetical protein
LYLVHLGAQADQDFLVEVVEALGVVVVEVGKSIIKKNENN